MYNPFERSTLEMGCALLGIKPTRVSRLRRRRANPRFKNAAFYPINVAFSSFRDSSALRMIMHEKLNVSPTLADYMV